MTTDDVKLLPPPEQPTQHIPRPDSFTEFRYPDRKRLMTTDDIEAAARRVYDVIFEGWTPPYIWEGAAESTRNSCRRIAAAVLGVGKPR